jgi:lipid-binding SYLF domain-containing protein
MNRSILFATTAITFGGFIAAGPAIAQTAISSDAAVNSHSSRNATSNSNDSSAAQLVNDATQTVQQIKGQPHFSDLLKKAKGVFIMPTVVKGAFIVGAKGAQGVLLKHNSDGTWSDPVFMNLASVSLGAQAGGKAGPAAMILMTDKALNDFTQGNNFSLDANAGLTIVNYSAQGQAPVGKGDIVVWSSQSGAFAGVDVNGASLSQNTANDRAYYGKKVDTKQILNGDVSNPQASKLKAELPA